MNTSSRFAFAVHVLALLSMQEGVPLSSDIIAGSVNTNPALIRRLLSMLAAAGLTTSQLGAGGGALLARGFRRDHAARRVSRGRRCATVRAAP